MSLAGGAKVKLHKTNCRSANGSLSHPLAGAGDCLVHRLPGPHLLLVPRLPGGEQVQQGVCDLRGRPVVGHGECGQENHPHLQLTSLACGSPLQTSLFFWWKKSNANKQQWAADQSEICRGSGQASLQWHSITCHHGCIIETGHWTCNVAAQRIFSSGHPTYCSKNPRRPWKNFSRRSQYKKKQVSNGCRIMDFFQKKNSKGQSNYPRTIKPSYCTCCGSYRGRVWSVHALWSAVFGSLKTVHQMHLVSK